MSGLPVPGSLTERAVEALDAADEAVDVGEPYEPHPDYCGCRTCEVSLVLAMAAEWLTAAGHARAAAALEELGS